MLTMQLRIIITLINLLFIAILPIICRYLAVSAGHAQPWLATISGHYLLAPERWVFAAGVGIFVIVHLWGTGLISSYFMKLNPSELLYCRRLEMLLLGVFLLIAWTPAQLVLGLHATLGGILVGISLLWMATLLQQITSQQVLCYWLGNGLFILAVVLACALVLSFPIDIVSELAASRGNMPRTLHLLAWDKRWLIFASLEWGYYYAFILFMATSLSAWQPKAI